MKVCVRRRDLHTCLVSIGLGLFAIVAQGAGFHELHIPVDSSETRLVARLWTPCAKPSGNILVKSGSDSLVINAVKDCAPEKKSLPLVVISHGMFGDVFDHFDTAEVLANAGFAVVTVNHRLDTLSSMKDRSADDIASFLARPVDIKRVLDFLLSPAQQIVDVDSRRIGFFGFSRGGYTGLVLAGAEPNFRAPAFHCPEDEFLMCRQLRDNAIPTHESGYEPRIRAFVIADPVSFFPDQASLQKVTAPIQLWSSQRGGMGVQPEAVANIARNLPEAPEFHRPAHSDHFAFLFPCSPEVAKMRPFVCTDPPGFDRTKFHREFNARVLKFLRRNLSVKRQ